MSEEVGTPAKGQERKRDSKGRFVRRDQQVTTEEHSNPEKNSPQKDTWDKWNVIVTAGSTFFIALATIATVAVTIHHAEIFSQQLTAMQGQLQEMKNQRLLTIAQQRAYMRQEGPQIIATGEGGKLVQTGEQLTVFSISPRWTNGGSTTAKNFRGVFDIESFDIPAGGKDLKESDCPSIPLSTWETQGGIVEPGSLVPQLAKPLVIEDAIKAKAETKYILMRGYIEYRDIYPDTALHFNDWCVVVIPNDIPRGIFSFLKVRESTD